MLCRSFHSFFFFSFCFCFSLGACQASHVLLVVKKMPDNAGDPEEIWVQSLGQKDVLEEGMSTHSSILAREIPWAEKPGTFHAVAGEAGKTEHLSTSGYD